MDNRYVRCPSKMGVAKIMLNVVRQRVFIEIFWSISILFSFKFAQDHEYVLFRSLCSLLFVLYQGTVPRGRNQLTWKTLTLERSHTFIYFEREVGKDFQNIFLARPTCKEWQVLKKSFHCSLANNMQPWRQCSSYLVPAWPLSSIL